MYIERLPYKEEVTESIFYVKKDKSNTNGIEISAKEIQIKKQIMTTIIEPIKNLFAFIDDIVKYIPFLHKLPTRNFLNVSVNK